VAQSANAPSILNQSITRSIFRWIHVIFGIPILGYIYSPFERIPKYAPLVRFAFVPILVLSGLWMWKGHVLQRLISKDRRMAQVRTHHASEPEEASTGRGGSLR
jgi:hypothetical protein